MLIRLVCLACVTMPLAVPLPPARESKQRASDEDRLQGTWQVASFEGNGNRHAFDGLVGVTLVVQGASMNFGDTKYLAFKLNAGQVPKELDIAGADGTYRCIYHLEGGTLKLCMPSKAEQPRPREFAAPAKSELIFMTLKRAPN